MNPSSIATIELVSMDTLNELRTLFTQLTGIPLVFTDANGKPVTPVDEPLRFCGALLGGHVPGSVCLRRRKWDEPEAEIEQQLRDEREQGHVLRHRCRGGFEDAAVPIEVQDTTIGYAVFARTLSAPPDIDRFRQLAVAGGMPPESGETVARQAMVMSPERIEALGRFLQIITGLVASAAYDAIRARRILELEELRDDLIHMVIHDLRTPLTSIIGGLQTVIDAECDLELAREFLPIAVSSAHTLVDMVSTLLDINRMESGRMPLDLGPTSLQDIVDLALAQVRGAATQRRHVLQTELDPQCPTIVGDGEKLRRVLINLLGNAVKFTPDGGTITVRTRCEPDGVLLAVSDTGPGIPADQLERIFDKYTQVEGARPARQSTGLGLTFCKLVAEAHGGRVWAQSQLGKGSTFYLWLPLEHDATRDQIDG